MDFISHLDVAEMSTIGMVRFVRNLSHVKAILSGKNTRRKLTKI